MAHWQDRPEPAWKDFQFNQPYAKGLERVRHVHPDRASPVGRARARFGRAPTEGEALTEPGLDRVAVGPLTGPVDVLRRRADRGRRGVATRSDGG